MTPSAQLDYLRRIAATKPQTRLSSAFSRLAALDKADELKRRPVSGMTMDDIIAELRQLGASR